jgi:hypothetical protein
MAGFGSGQVMQYVTTRVKAAADTVSAGAQGLQSEGIVGDAVQILTSGFGLLPINEFGKAAQKRREAARAHLSSLGR